MQDTRPTAQRTSAYSQAERDAICQQMERILANPLFRHSKRYPHLLRHVVERTLAGHASELKERTIGVELFGREPDYDTNADPIVRTTAGEVRKRIAQYYFEPGHEAEVRIDLTPGGYVPEFVLPETPAPQPAAPGAPEPAVTAAEPVPSPGRRRWRHPAALAAAAVLVLAAIAIAAFAPWKAHPILDQFWGPVLESPNPVLLCVGQRLFLGASPEPQQPASGDTARVTASPLTLFSLYYLGSQNVAVPDVITVGRLTGLLQSRGRAYRIRGESVATFDELREGPVVLVGAFNNDWTLRLAGPMRFSFERDGDTFRIRDRKDPSRKDISVDYSMPYMRLTRDYALVTRVLEPTTERMVVIAAGLTGYGTIAAGEFLTNPAYMEAVLKQAPRDWSRKNLQVVLTTRVINGNSGPPRIVAQHFW
jgi:hypothetical protein